jgi:hypothetical protein
MRVTEDEQIYKDLDWYCVDGEGRVGHFTSAGYKQIPPSVAESAEDLEFLNKFFRQLSAVREGHELDEQLTQDKRTERYLQSFVAMAERGLYSFDIESYLHPEICYVRVAIPRAPLMLKNLPERVREVLGRTVLKERSLELSSAIPYAETLGI